MLEVGQITQTIQVIWVTFLPGQAGLIHEKNYLDVTWTDHMRLTVLHLVEQQAVQKRGMVEPCL